MMNVLLVEQDIDNTVLENALHGITYTTQKIQYTPFFVSFVKEVQPDIIIFNIDNPSNKLIEDVKNIIRILPLPVIMFAQTASKDTIHNVIEADISAFVVDGLSRQRIHTIIDIAIARFKQKQRLTASLETLHCQLEDRKQIDRAKAILIKTQNYTEHEAYHTLRKLAMDRNITLGNMAKNVIAMAELLK